MSDKMDAEYTAAVLIRIAQANSSDAETMNEVVRIGNERQKRIEALEAALSIIRKYVTEDLSKIGYDNEDDIVEHPAIRIIDIALKATLRDGTGTEHQVNRDG